MEEINIKITSNLEDLKKLIDKANQQTKELLETLNEIKNFKLEIGTEEFETKNF